jgi:hypothetical protein
VPAELAARKSGCNAHIGELLDTVGDDGTGLTVTTTVPEALTQPRTVRVTEYVPLAELVTDDTIRF